jgi:hypothetical protein
MITSRSLKCSFKSKAYPTTNFSGIENPTSELFKTYFYNFYFVQNPYLQSGMYPELSAGRLINKL